MIYLPDTNVWIAYLNSRESPVKAALAKHRLGDIGLCSVVKAELLYGAFRSSQREANLEVLRVLFSQMHSLSFDDNAADHYGRIRADLMAQGTPIGPNDLMIAAIALTHDLVLVTNNTREFSRVSGLRIEDWS